MNMINIIDETTYKLIIKLMSNGMTNFMLFMSHLGSAITLIILTIAFILLMKNKTNAKFIAINLILVFVINRILKFDEKLTEMESFDIMKVIDNMEGNKDKILSYSEFLLKYIEKNVDRKEERKWEKELVLGR